MSSNARLSHDDFTMTDPAALSTHAVLERAVRGDGATRVVILDPRFQGLPDAAHGGTILALFDSVASATGARTIAGAYRRRVPLATPLQLAIDRDDSATRFSLSDGATLLVDGVVDAGTAPLLREAEAADAPRAGGCAPLGPVGSRLRLLPTSDVGAQPPALGASAASASRNASPLPISRTCFACGVENPLGLRVQLAIDEVDVSGRWMPHAAFRLADRTVAPVALTTLLDEAAFWLGAAASGESGMTTDLRVRLYGTLPSDGLITVAGARNAVRAHAADARYWETEVDAWDDAGRPVASARITFVAVRGAARKLVTGLLAMNPPEVLRQIFPAYVR
jgi:acyl-coenzyme A thioesterase PaaI-like protein